MLAEALFISNSDRYLCNTECQIKFMC